MELDLTIEELNDLDTQEAMPAGNCCSCSSSCAAET